MSKKPKINADGKYEGVIYKYTNMKTGKPYVGKTDNEDNRKKSWKRRSDSAYGGKKIKEARQLYNTSEDMWHYEVLEKLFANTHDELQKKLSEREEYWIRHENAVENGYNSSYGQGQKGKKLTPAERAQNGKNRKGKPLSDEAKEKIRKATTGRKHSAVTKQKISQKLKGKKRTPEQCKAMSDARKGKIPQAAKEGADRWREANGGSYWKGKTMSNEARANMKKVQQERGTSCVAIFPDGHEESYNTMLDAAKATGHNVGSVASAIKTGGITKKQFKFRR